MAAFHGHHRRDDERVRHVQRAGHELFAPATGHGQGRHDAEGFRQSDTEERDTVGGHCGAGKLLGLVPRARLQAPGDAGHYVVRRGADAGVRDAGRAAGSRTEAEEGVPRPGRHGGGGYLRDLPAWFAALVAGGKRSRNHPGHERPTLRHDYCRCGVCDVLRHAQDSSPFRVGCSAARSSRRLGKAATRKPATQIVPSPAHKPGFFLECCGSAAAFEVSAARDMIVWATRPTPQKREQSSRTPKGPCSTLHPVLPTNDGVQIWYSAGREILFNSVANSRRRHNGSRIVQLHYRVGGSSAVWWSKCPTGKSAAVGGELPVSANA